jgi:RimJ/RimL family protein N-acetyltransferase
MRDLSDTALVSDRLSLTAFTADDAPEAFAGASATVARFMKWEPAPSLEAFADLWRNGIAGMKAGNELSLVLRLRSTGEFLGLAALHNIGSADVEIGIWLKESAHGLGYGREAIAAIVAWACEHVAAEGFIWPVVEQNQPSRRLVESLGGVVVGRRVLKKAGGDVFNQLVYRIPGRSR